MRSIWCLPAHHLLVMLCCLAFVAGGADGAGLAPRRPVAYSSSVSSSTASNEVDAAFLLFGTRSKPAPSKPSLGEKLKNWVGGKR